MDYINNTPQKLQPCYTITSVLQACYKLVTKVVFFTAVLWQGRAELQCLEQPCCNLVCHSKVVNKVVPCTNFLLILLIVLAGPI